MACWAPRAKPRGRGEPFLHSRYQVLEGEGRGGSELASHTPYTAVHVPCYMQREHLQPLPTSVGVALGPAGWVRSR